MISIPVNTRLTQDTVRTGIYAEGFMQPKYDWAHMTVRAILYSNDVDVLNVFHRPSKNCLLSALSTWPGMFSDGIATVACAQTDPLLVVAVWEAPVA